MSRRGDLRTRAAVAAPWSSPTPEAVAPTHPRGISSGASHASMSTYSTTSSEMSSSLRSASVASTGSSGAPRRRPLPPSADRPQRPLMDDDDENGDDNAPSDDDVDADPDENDAHADEEDRQSRRDILSPATTHRPWPEDSPRKNGYSINNSRSHHRHNNNNNNDGVFHASDMVGDREEPEADVRPRIVPQPRHQPPQNQLQPRYEPINPRPTPDDGESHASQRRIPKTPASSSSTASSSYSHHSVSLHRSNEDVSLPLPPWHPLPHMVLDASAPVATTPTPTAMTSVVRRWWSQSNATTTSSPHHHALPAPGSRRPRPSLLPTPSLPRLSRSQPLSSIHSTTPSSVLFASPPPPPTTTMATPTSAWVRSPHLPRTTPSDEVQVGYLRKRGTSVPGWKRRWFVSAPSTTVLYYFLHPTDLTPRGVIELDARTRIEPVESSFASAASSDPRDRSDTTPFRFAIAWDDPADDDHDPPDDHETANSSPSPLLRRREKRIELEARTRAEGEQWMQWLREERVSFQKAQRRAAEAALAASRTRVQELTHDLSQLRLVEQDREDALAEAQHWQQAWQQLNDAVRVLTQHIYRQVPSSTTASATADESTAVATSDPKESSTVSSTILEAESTKITETNVDVVTSRDSTIAVDNGSTKNVNGKNALDTLYGGSAKHRNESSVSEVESRSIATFMKSLAESPSTEAMVWHVPGTHFGGLFNACEHLKDSLRMASEEAATAIEDVQQAHERVRTLDTRMEQAEKHLCQLWEENCAVRKALKQKKREKRVLVREVKNLLQQSAQPPRELPGRAADPAESAHGLNDVTTQVDDSEEEKLIDELEAHLSSSIHLHEQLLHFNPGRSKTKDGRDFSPALCSSTPIRSTEKRTSPVVRLRPVRANKLVTQKRITSSKVINIGSLFDSGSENETEGDEHMEDEQSTTPSFVSSVVAEASEDEQCRRRLREQPDLISVGTSPNDESSSNSPERPNPLTLLDQENGDQETNSTRNSRESNSNPHSKFFHPVQVITQNQATSKLECPLADVAEMIPRTRSPCNELQVYHLTFYSRKIGIQFQKVPPPPPRKKGLITDALTADLLQEPTGSNNTAAELRRIAALSSGNSHVADGGGSVNQRDNNDDVLNISTPVDAVLVCGFHGFDMSSSPGATSLSNNDQIRPRLGARLVAFDGISVEVGNWTFDSIRKAIQVRGRPLTLSFRNDFLTTEQRKILTRAILEVSNDRGGITAIRTSGNLSTEDAKENANTKSQRSVMEASTFVQHGETQLPLNSIPRSGKDVMGKVSGEDGDDFSLSNASSQSGSLSVGNASNRSHRSTTSWWRQHQGIVVAPTSFSGNQSVASASSYHQGYDVSHDGLPAKGAHFRSFSEVGSSTVSALSGLAPSLVSSLLVRHHRLRKEPDYLTRRAIAVEETPQHQDFHSELI